MNRVTVRLDSAEHRALVEISRAYDGNLAAALRSLIHRETITKSVVSLVAAELKSALAPIAEAGEAVIKNQEIAAHALKNNFQFVLDTINKKR